MGDITSYHLRHNIFQSRSCLCSRCLLTVSVDVWFEILLICGAITLILLTCYLLFVYDILLLYIVSTYCDVRSNNFLFLFLLCNALCASAIYMYAVAILFVCLSLCLCVCLSVCYTVDH